MQVLIAPMMSVLCVTIENIITEVIITIIKLHFISGFTLLWEVNHINTKTKE